MDGIVNSLKKHLIWRSHCCCSQDEFRISVEITPGFPLVLTQQPVNWVIKSFFFMEVSNLVVFLSEDIALLFAAHFAAAAIQNSTDVLYWWRC